MSALDAEVERQRTRVHIGRMNPSFTRADVGAASFDALGVDNSFSLESFRAGCRIGVLSSTRDELCFELVGADASVANALRRILISEVPTVAIESVRFRDNTSIVQDEVLAHRFGLVPLAVDPRMLEYRKRDENGVPGEPAVGDTVVFDVEVTCRDRRPGDGDAGDGEYVNGEVTTATFKHRPFGDESAELLECSRPVHDDILLAKMRPGQRISAELHAEKGIGRVHAKWSPVATASYRLLPEITVFDDVTGTAADELVATCPMKVFDIEDAGSPQRRAVAARPRDCTMCRECIRPAGWDKRVRLTRVRDHFLFTIESTGALSAEDLFREAIKVFRAKLANVVSMLDAKEAPEDNE